MRLFYFVMAHRLPLQVRALADAIAAEPDTIMLHVDKKQDLAAFRTALEGTKVQFCGHRVNVHWGGFSQVQCILTGMRAFILSDCDYFVLLSGQDFPVRPISELKRFFSDNNGLCFINLDTVESQWGRDPARLRQRYFVDFWARLGSGSGLAQKALNNIEGIVNRTGRLFPARKRPVGLRLYGGSSWFSLPRKAVQHILRCVEEDKSLTDYFRYTISADEMFFHTILGNSPFRDLCRPSLTFAHFRYGSRNPEVLTHDHLPLLADRTCFFARKFDFESNPSLRTELERKL